jgi:hypothetical protein
VDAPDLLVLHALRLRTLAGAEQIAARFALPAETVDDSLRRAAAAGWVVHRDGRMSGWRLTSVGRVEGERLLADELDAAGARSVVLSQYEAFLVLNPELLAVCTDWQVVVTPAGELVNDHDDPEHDAAVLDRLDALHDQIVPVTTALAGTLSRFTGYTDRLTAAHERVRAGDHDWITRPVIDSYHTVWFELHEDLLATLGRERSQERA